ncbi:MAG: hypothetical protein U5J82_08385 [Desulfobacterales bacterium]|nr:hypothetical protein [Desulfobacterales bacterium]
MLIISRPAKLQWQLVFSSRECHGIFEPVTSHSGAWAPRHPGRENPGLCPVVRVGKRVGGKTKKGEREETIAVKDQGGRKKKKKNKKPNTRKKESLRTKRKKRKRKKI